MRTLQLVILSQISVLALAGCGPSATPLPATSTPASVAPSAEPTSEPTQAPTAVPTLDPQAFVDGAGLTLTTAEGLWEVNATGQMDLIVDQSQARLSPDGSMAAFLMPDPMEAVDDVWLQDVATGNRTNLTNTPDRYETLPSWWPGRPDVLVFGSGLTPGMDNSDLPTVVKLDGSGYQVLDDSLGGPRALAPDGNRIAYAAYSVPGAVYTWGKGPAPFDPAAYGVPADHLIQPSFSPDGNQLAWMIVGGDTEPTGSYFGLAVFDLRAQTGQLFHKFHPVGGQTPAYVNWSPDGNWIAFVSFGEPPATGRAGNLWVIHPDGSQETYVGEGLNPVWSPDGSQLAYVTTGASGAEEIWLAPANSWQPRQLALPDPSKRALFLMGWSIP